jgi:hypothetical protein
MVLTIAVAGVAIGVVVLLYPLWIERRRYARVCSLAQENARRLFEIERAGRIGHWLIDEARQTASWSAQMFELVGIPRAP